MQACASGRSHQGAAVRQQAQRSLTEATDTAYQLSLALYKRGSHRFLDVLDAQRSLYSAQQSLISLKLAEQTNRVGSPAHAN